MRPATEAELAEAIRGANGPLAVRGGGTRGPSGPGEPVETGALSGISLYDPGALTLVAGAGTPMAEIEAALVAENQRLAFEPMDHRALLGTSGEPSLGGAVAVGASGPRRIQAGALRDSLIGVRFVDGSGTVVRNGGRVMKNVTGYDLVKLMAGSHGTLGVLTEVAFKLLPGVETSATLVLEGLSDAEGIAALTRALGSPYEVSGAAFDGRALVRVEGMAGSVAYRIVRLREMLGGEVAEVDWAAIRDVAAFAGEGGVWRASVKPTDGPGLVAALAPDARLYDWGGGLVWLRKLGDAAALQAFHSRVQAEAAARGGHATCVRGGCAPTFQPEAPAVARLSAGLRAQFDPRGILNPGRMEAA